MIYPVSAELYLQTAARLHDAIDGKDYFSGSVRFSFEGIECRLVASLIVYRTREERPEGVAAPVSDLVPVWWEFHTTGPDGELPNDFSFTELTPFLLA